MKDKVVFIDLLEEMRVSSKLVLKDRSDQREIAEVKKTRFFDEGSILEAKSIP